MGRSIKCAKKFPHTQDHKRSHTANILSSKLTFLAAGKATAALVKTFQAEAKAKAEAEKEGRRMFVPSQIFSVFFSIAYVVAH